MKSSACTLVAVALLGCAGLRQPSLAPYVIVSGPKTAAGRWPAPLPCVSREGFARFPDVPAFDLGSLPPGKTYAVRRLSGAVQYLCTGERVCFDAAGRAFPPCWEPPATGPATLQITSDSLAETEVAVGGAGAGTFMLPAKASRTLPPLSPGRSTIALSFRCGKAPATATVEVQLHAEMVTEVTYGCAYDAAP